MEQGEHAQCVCNDNEPVSSFVCQQSPISYKAFLVVVHRHFAEFRVFVVVADVPMLASCPHMPDTEHPGTHTHTPHPFSYPSPRDPRYTSTEICEGS